MTDGGGSLSVGPNGRGGGGVLHGPHSGVALPRGHPGPGGLPQHRAHPPVIDLSD